MKSAEITNMLSRHVMPSIGNSYRQKGRLIYRFPAELLVRGFWFENFRYSKSEFYVHVFVHPLYLPEAELDFMLGFRLGEHLEGAWRFWKYDGDDSAEELVSLASYMRREGCPLLELIDSPGSLVANIEKLCTDSQTIRTAEKLAYSCILAGDDLAAKRRLEDITGRRSGEDQRPWVLRIVERADGIRRKLMKDRRLAIGTLIEWADKSRRILGLEQ